MFNVHSESLNCPRKRNEVLQLRSPHLRGGTLSEGRTPVRCSTFVTDIGTSQLLHCANFSASGAASELLRRRFSGVASLGQTPKDSECSRALSVLTSPYQLAHAALGCQAVCTLVMDAHLTGPAAQSVLSMCSCQAHSTLWLGTACPFLWSGQKSLKERETSSQLILI